MIILCLTGSCLAQSYYEKQDSAINQDINRLTQKGVDTICVYKSYCVGCLLVLYSSHDTICRRQPYANETYFLWKHNSVTAFTKKDYCFTYDTIAINANALWSFYSSAKNQISSKKIKDAEIRVIEHGKKTTNYVMVDHDEHEDIFLAIGGVYKKLFLTEFPFEKIVDHHWNINYTNNWNTDTKKFQVLLDELIHINAGKLKIVK
ncbi:MAG: hypothetical protein JST19_06965 [Bacteroidetes bacterium]|nr:hypothetical protein [Bacteroidota bacterium]